LVNLPTIITVSRILLIPFFVLLTGPKPLLGAALFALASLTDLLDGYLARRSNQVTKLGIILDPVADKLLVISALIVLVDIGGLIPAWIAIVIITREFVVTGLRIIALSRDMVIPAELGGKIKLITQTAAILALLVHRSFFAFALYNIGIILLWSAMIIGIVSGVQYFISFWRRL